MLPMETQTQPPPSAAPREDPRGDITSELWLDPHTCAWGPDTNDPPFTCAQPWTCTTNRKHVVGCASGSSAASAFPTTCVDGSQITISDVRSSMWNQETAFCIDATAPACVTLLFPGDPPASQFRCQPTATLISLLSVPWDVAASQGFSASRLLSLPPPRQEREGFGLGPMMYVDGNGEHQPRKSMETVTEESAGGSSRVGESSAMGRAGMQTAAGVGGAGGGVGVNKGKGKMDAGGFGRAARVSDSSSRCSEPDGMGWKR